MVVWTPELNERFRAMRVGPNKISIAEMARHFGTTEAAIYAHARIINCLVMDRKDWTEKEVEELIRLDDALTSLPKIGSALGRSEGSIAWKLRELGRAGKRRQIAAAQAEARRATKAEQMVSKPGRIRQRAPQARPATHQKVDPAIIKAIATEAEKGTAIDGIAATLGMDSKRVQSLAWRFKIKIQPKKEEIPSEVIDRIRAAIEREEPLSLVSKEMKMDLRKVRRIANDAGLPLPAQRPRRTPREIIEQARPLAERGLSLSEAARAIKCDFSTLKSLAEKASIAFAAPTPKFPKPKAKAASIAPKTPRPKQPNPRTATVHGRPKDKPIDKIETKRKISIGGNASWEKPQPQETGIKIPGRVMSKEEVIAKLLASRSANK